MQCSSSKAILPILFADLISLSDIFQMVSPLICSFVHFRWFLLVFRWFYFSDDFQMLFKNRNGFRWFSDSDDFQMEKDMPELIKNGLFFCSPLRCSSKSSKNFCSWINWKRQGQYWTFFMEFWEFLHFILTES